MVRPGDRLGVGGFHFSRLPLALVRSAIRAGARDLDYVSWGGGLALELLLAANAIRAMKLCFDSLDVFGLAPRFRQAVERGEIPLQDWTALGMMQGFHAAQFGLPSLPFPPPLGSELIERAGFARMAADPIAGTSVAAAPALPLDVFLLHAQRADADGNVEIQGARGLDLSCIFAARKVLVTVEERVPAGAFRHAAPRAFIVPRSFVTAVADVPYGAWPTSCLPYYPTDYMALQQSIEGETLEIAPPDEHRRQWLGAAAALPPERVTAPALLRRRRDELESGPATVAEVMIDWIARTIDNASICSVGSVSPLATVAYLLAKRTHAPDLLLMTSNGGLIDVAPRPMVMTLAEPLDFQTAALHCGGDESYHWWYQRGRVTHEVVSAAQIDRWGATNNIQVTSPSGRTIRLPGQGGMADVANMHRHFLLYLPRQSPLSLVERVSYVSAARGLLDPAARTAAGYQPGDVRLITNLGAFELNPERREFELTSIHPGGTVDDVQAATGFPLRISPKLCETPAPSAETLRLIREEIDPLGIRRLEFVAGKERGPLLTALIESENAAIGDLIGAAGSGGGEHG
ncbi:MAG: CoA-transferase [Thermomicrobiales bacterium]|nr:CoA-transferase [Thermomicrobiales bacterium]